MKVAERFYGAGSSTPGLTKVVLKVPAEVDGDGCLRDTYESDTPCLTLVPNDLWKVMNDHILDDRSVSPRDYPVLARCAPCQSFSTIMRGQQRRSDVKLFGPICWGCDFITPDTRAHSADRYLELDHVTPITGGGSYDLSNRALLCRPCNGDKSDTRTIVWHRQQAGYATGRKQGTRHEIDLEIARVRIEEHARGLGE